MPTTYIDNYEIEYSAAPLGGCGQWGAYVAVYAPSGSPMHRINILRKRRVAADQRLADEAAAHAAAQAALPDIVASLKGTPGRR